MSEHKILGRKKYFCTKKIILFKNSLDIRKNIARFLLNLGLKGLNYFQKFIKSDFSDL